MDNVDVNVVLSKENSYPVNDAMVTFAVKLIAERLKF